MADWKDVIKSTLDNVFGFLKIPWVFLPLLVIVGFQMGWLNEKLFNLIIDKAGTILESLKGLL